MNNRDQWFREADAVSRKYVMRTLSPKWRGRPKDDIEDAFQEALIRLHAHLQKGGRFEGPKPLRSWMYRTTNNVLQDGFRKEGKLGIMVSLEDRTRQAHQLSDDGMLEPFGEFEEKILMERRWDWLMAQFATAAPKHGALILGFHIEGRSMDELATLLGFCDRNSAKVAKRKFLSKLEERAKVSGLFLDKAA